MNQKHLPLAIIRDVQFQEHRMPPGHPERSERLATLDKIIEELTENAPADILQLPYTPASREDVLRVHTEKHFETIKETEGKLHVALDPDTHTSPLSFAIALKAAGACMAAVDSLFNEKSRAAFSLIRPPGHHAESFRAMGFCLFNNVAIAAAYAREKYSLERVAIVDWDVHHGNGTQEIFYHDPNVLYISTHQYPFYPGTGHFSELGEGAGKGFNINLPLRAGLGDADYSRVFAEIICPLLRQYRPQLILVSAGYDAYVNDPLGGMALSPNGFADLTRQIQSVADEVCPARLAFVLEGGYDLDGLRTCIAATLEVLLRDKGAPNTDDKVASEMQAITPSLLRQFKSAFADYWQLK